ncbi:MAG: hexokinase family protein [Bacteroidales bacterium]
MNADEFLTKHKLRAADIDIQQLVEDFSGEMIMGLTGKESSLRMIPTYIEADNEFLTEVPVVAIDAGGTNFRAANVKISVQGKLEISSMVNAGMPGLDREVSKTEFFETMASHVKDHVTKSDRIGFCFSYPTEIFPDKDGKLLQFCKEVQAPGVVGEMIGKNLLETLGTPDKQIVLLNDTVATLLAGKLAAFGHDYDSFIGYILGTGTNTCYIENNSEIFKNPELDKSKSQIINIESGNFAKAPRTDIDIAFDNTTSNPGNYSFEKMFSGGYFGGLCLHALKAAAAEGVFSAVTAAEIKTLKELTTEDVSRFVSGLADRGPLQLIMKDNSDGESCARIINSLIDRSSLLVAGNLAAVVLKSGKGKSPERPILITIEGTTFYKLQGLKPSFEKYFSRYLSGEIKRYYEFTEVPQSSLVGAALAAMIN